ncbi:MAG: hypothetical protein FJX46_12375 [Alphaproteobacteria bacterium]|nr:hypothetical protein [Alphaproteobacteria bacterium]
MIRQILFRAAREIATNPALREVAIELARKARPHAARAVHAVRDAAREIDPRRDPKEFLRRVRAKLGQG